MVKDKKTHGSHRILFLYWFILLLWQNITGQQARSGIDMVLKIGLIGLLSYYFFSRSMTVKRNHFIYFLILLSSVLTTFFVDGGYSSSAVIAYVFPPLFVLLTCCVGAKQKLSMEEYLQYIRLVIYVVLYMIIYSFIFETSHFTNLSALTTAYGNELSSFLMSNLEYGMYLTFAVIGCLICLHYENCTKLKRFFYIAVIFLCFVNLLFTYSRTSIIASLFAVVIYTISANKKTIPLFLGIAVVGVYVAVQVPVIGNFITNIVFKGGTASGRDIMIQTAFSYYWGEPLINKVFGLGYSQGGEIIRQLTNHGSLHNGFVQLLFINGLLGLSIAVLFLAANIFSAIRTLRYDRFLGGVFIALGVMPIVFMMTCTAIIFHSTIDSAMLTIYSIVIPSYVRNNLKETKQVDGEH